MTDDGQPEIYRRLYRCILSDAQSEDEAASEVPQSVTCELTDDVILTTSEAQSAVEKPKGYSRSLVAELADQRRTIVAAGLSQSPDLAYDCTVFMIASRVLNTFTPDLGFELTARKASRASFAVSHELTPAAEFLEEQLARLDMTWMQAPSVETRFLTFQTLAPAAKADILAYCLSEMCKPNVQPDAPEGSGLRYGFLELLGTLMGLQIRDWWAPTAANFWERLNKKQILTALDDIDAIGLKPGYMDQKKQTLADSMERLFRGEGHVSPEINERARAWAPSILRVSAELPAAGALTADEHDLQAEILGPAEAAAPPIEANEGADDTSPSSDSGPSDLIALDDAA